MTIAGDGGNARLAFADFLASAKLRKGQQRLQGEVEPVCKTRGSRRISGSVVVLRITTRCSWRLQIELESTRGWRVNAGTPVIGWADRPSRTRPGFDGEASAGRTHPGARTGREGGDVSIKGPDVALEDAAALPVMEVPGRLKALDDQRTLKDPGFSATFTVRRWCARFFCIPIARRFGPVDGGRNFRRRAIGPASGHLAHGARFGSDGSFLERRLEEASGCRRSIERDRSGIDRRRDHGGS